MAIDPYDRAKYSKAKPTLNFANDQIIKNIQARQGSAEYGAGQSILTLPSGSGGRRDGGGGGDGGAAARAAAAEAKAKKAAKDQARKENENTQKIIDALLGGLAGYAKGRDTQISNAQLVLERTLRGIGANYAATVGDYEETLDLNEQDEAGKSATAVQNRARERMSLLEQAAAQGAGETDQLRAQLQAFQNYDANALEIARAFYDTQRAVNSQIAGANAQAENARRNAALQQQEQIGQAWDNYYKNYSDTWTNIQRTAAGNTNIASDYSVEFKPNFGGKDPVKEAARYAGMTYKQEDKDEEWYASFDGRIEGRDTRTTSPNRAAAVSIQAPRAAEGATLRRKW